MADIDPCVNNTAQVMMLSDGWFAHASIAMPQANNILPLSNGCQCYQLDYLLASSELLRPDHCVRLTKNFMCCDGSLACTHRE